MADFASSICSRMCQPNSNAGVNSKNLHFAPTHRNEPATTAALRLKGFLKLAVLTFNYFEKILLHIAAYMF
jgi:hypothetical protein